MSIISNQQLQKCFVSTICNHIRVCCTLARTTVQACLVQLEKGIELVFFLGKLCGIVQKSSKVKLDAIKIIQQIIKKKHLLYGYIRTISLKIASCSNI